MSEETKLRTVWREDKADWEAEIARLRRLGDEMAKQIEERWTGPYGCDCSVCSTAAAWRKSTGGQSDGRPRDPTKRSN